MKTNIIIYEYEFDKVVEQFAYRYFIDFKKVSAIEYECVFMVKPFMKYVQHKSTTIRKISLTVLGEAKYTGAIDLFIKALNDRSAKVQGTAAFYLGQFQDRAAVKPLLLATNDHRCAYAATVALRDLLGKDLEPEMVKALSDPDSMIRTGAGVVLLNFRKTPDITNAFVKALRNKNYKVRRVAAVALGHGDSITACKSIIASLKKGETRVDVWDAKIGALERLKYKLKESLKAIEEFSDSVAEVK